jgi:hypothetical protein
VASHRGGKGKQNEKFLKKYNSSIKGILCFGKHTQNDNYLKPLSIFLILFTIKKDYTVNGKLCQINSLGAVNSQQKIDRQGIYPSDFFAGVIDAER